MRKKILIGVCIPIGVFSLFCLVYILFYPIVVFNDEYYNRNSIKKVTEERIIAHQNLRLSVNEKINDLINKQINYYFLDVINYVTSINAYGFIDIENSHNISKMVVYNGFLIFLDDIQDADLAILSKAELRILRNTLFAKYGLIFQSDDLRTHFSKFNWYTPEYHNVDDRLTNFDSRIIERIQFFENIQSVTNVNIRYGHFENNFEFLNVIKGLYNSIIMDYYEKAEAIDLLYYDTMKKYKIITRLPFQNTKVYNTIDIFPPYASVIEYNNRYYDEYIINILNYNSELLKENIINLSDIQVEMVLEYIYESSVNLNNNQYTYYLYITNKIINSIISYFNYLITEFAVSYIQRLNVNKIENDIDFLTLLPFSIIKIDDNHYNEILINELMNSMSIFSDYFLTNTKEILIRGVNYQTRMFKNNIDAYIDWYYSAFTRFERRITNILGFFTGGTNEEKYFRDNFNRIMNRNVNFDHIVKDDIDTIIRNINTCFENYINILNYISLNIDMVHIDFISREEYISPFINHIIMYFDHVFEALDRANHFFYQDYNVKDNAIAGAAWTSAKLLANFNFLGGLAFDFLSLQTQRLLNSSNLKEQLYNRMIENQQNKIEIINNPINYIINNIPIGSLLYVDNYFVGLNTYQHYGVYIGNGKVIHFAPLEGQEISSENGVIHETTIVNFLKGRSLQIDSNVETIFSENEIVQRARSRLGEKGYNLLTNNCEHFARWCVTGENKSYQVINSPEKLSSITQTIVDRYYTFSKFIELFN